MHFLISILILSLFSLPVVCSYINNTVMESLPVQVYQNTITRWYRWGPWLQHKRRHKQKSKSKRTTDEHTLSGDEEAYKKQVERARESRSNSGSVQRDPDAYTVQDNGRQRERRREISTASSSIWKLVDELKRRGRDICKNEVAKEEFVQNGKKRRIPWKYLYCCICRT